MTAAVVAAGLVTAGPASAQECADVDVVFARGTGQAAGLGNVGESFAASVRTSLPGRTVTTYGVDYAANASQSSAGPGASDMTDHVTEVAARCADTVFVVGGYSQGASVTDISIGIRTSLGVGRTIPQALAPRVAAVVAFGNPLGLSGRTIASASTTYGPKAQEFCNTGDPVCGNGGDPAAHLAYVDNGSATEGGVFAAGKADALAPAAAAG